VQSPARTSSEVLDDQRPVFPASRSALDWRGLIFGALLPPSHILHIEVLQRSLESTQYDRIFAPVRVRTVTANTVDRNVYRVDIGQRRAYNVADLAGGDAGVDV
jgi:hypothetical protein